MVKTLTVQGKIMNDTISYDVFISYRRATGANDARLLEQALKARGFNVFFDYDSLRNGKFDEHIYKAIEEAPAFILIMTSGCLDGCMNEDDWVRHEIEYALSFKDKMIIPIAPSDQSWSFPTNLPPIMKELKMIQVSELNKASLFEASIDKMIEDRFPKNIKIKVTPIKSNEFNLLIGKAYEYLIDFREAIMNNYSQEKVDIISDKLKRCMKDFDLFYEKYQYSDKINASNAKIIYDEYIVFWKNLGTFIQHPVLTRQHDPEAKQYAEQANASFLKLFNFIKSIIEQNINK